MRNASSITQALLMQAPRRLGLTSRALRRLLVVLPAMLVACGESTTGSASSELRVLDRATTSIVLPTNDSSIASAGPVITTAHPTAEVSSAGSPRIGGTSAVPTTSPAPPTLYQWPHVGITAQLIDPNALTASERAVQLATLCPGRAGSWSLRAITVVASETGTPTPGRRMWAQSCAFPDSTTPPSGAAIEEAFQLFDSVTGELVLAFGDLLEPVDSSPTTAAPATRSAGGWRLTETFLGPRNEVCCLWQLDPASANAKPTTAQNIVIDTIIGAPTPGARVVARFGLFSGFIEDDTGATAGRQLRHVPAWIVVESPIVLDQTCTASGFTSQCWLNIGWHRRVVADADLHDLTSDSRGSGNWPTPT